MINYLGKTFLTCLSHFSQKNIAESGMTTLEHTQEVYQKFSLLITLLMVPRTTKTESYT